MSNLRDLSLEQLGCIVEAANGEYLLLIGETKLVIKLGDLVLSTRFLLMRICTNVYLTLILKKCSCVMDLGNQKLLAG